MKPRFTVYIPSHDYGRFLTEAVDSVITQTLADWELIIVDDGSTDETSEVAQRYAAVHPERIRVVRHDVARGLRACANQALELARGEYFMRLDADDFLDENALLVLGAYLDTHADVALVYPNYIYVDEAGRFLGLENRKKVDTEARLLDLPAHGACTAVRTRVLKSVGGYAEDGGAQDGYELWLKVLHRYPVANVATPLFHYRQHATSMSKHEDRILSSRRRIKRRAAEHRDGGVRPRVVAIVPAKNTYPDKPDIVLDAIAGKPLVDYTLDVAVASGIFDAVFVTTDDQRVVDHCARVPGVLAALRPDRLSAGGATLADVVVDAVERLESDFDVHADVVVLLSVHSPLRRADHVQEALDTLELYHADSVISVYEDFDLHFAHGAYGLEPINRGMLRKLRLEREALYVNNGAIHAFWRDLLRSDDLYGRKVGHVVMALTDSIQIKGAFDRWVVEEILKARGAAALPPLARPVAG